MAFVNEVLPPGNPEREKHGFSRWTIDRERDAFLRCTANGRQNKPDFMLYRYSDGKPMAGATATYRATQNGEGTHDYINYEVGQLRIVPEFEDEWLSIVCYFREALREYGASGRKVARHTITVEIPEEVITSRVLKGEAARDGSTGRGQLWHS